MKKYWKEVKVRLFWWLTGVLTGVILLLDVAFARSIDMSKAGVSLWIFISVGAFIILLQLVPAIILFVTFVGYSTKKIYDKIPSSKSEQADLLSEYLDEGKDV